MSSIQEQKKSSESFVKSFFGFSMSTWINCIIEFISTPIVAFFFAPEEFGKISMYLTYVDLFLAFSYLGLDQAFTRFYNEPTGKNNKKSLLTVCMSGAMASCIVITAIIFIIGQRVSVAIIDRVNYLIPLCVAIGVFSQCVLRFFRLTSRMQKNAKMYAIQSISVTWVKKISFIFIAFASPTALPAIVSIALCLLTVTVIFFFIRLKTDFSFDCDYSKKAVTPILKYSTPLIFVEIILKLDNKISTLVLNSFMNKEMVGIYSFSVHIAAIINLIRQGFNAYWTPFVYENYKTQQKRIEKVHHTITFVMITFALLIIMFQYPIFLILSNGEYDAGRAVFALLIVGPVCYTISETLGLGIHLSKKTYWHIFISAINIVINLVLSIVLIPRIGLIGAALSSAVAAVFNLILKTVIGEKYYKCTSSYWRTVLSLVFLLSAGVISYLLHTSIYKYIFFAVFILIEFIIYRKEFVRCVKIMISILSKILNKKIRS